MKKILSIALALALGFTIGCGGASDTKSTATKTGDTKATTAAPTTEKK